MKRRRAAHVATPVRPGVARHTQEILGSLARVLAMSGESPRLLAAEFAKICRGVSVPRLAQKLVAASSLEHGHAISHWYSDPDYLDANGLPKALPLRGDPSITQLVTRHMPQADPAAVLATLRRLGALSKEGRRFRPVSRHVLMGRQREEKISLLVYVLGGMLRTIEHNASCGPHERLPDRIAINPRFPVRHLPAYYVRLRKHSTELLRHADASMYSKARRVRREPTTQLGVIIMALEDPLVTGEAANAASRMRRDSRAARGGRRR
jgi:hypothetical protein